MFDPWLFLLLLTAIASGWLLGRRAGSRKSTTMAQPVFNTQYYRGLNYLLNEQPDDAIDTFIRALDVNSETLETHIALGNLMRKRGEVERAIRIHQNLLARPTLAKSQLHQAHLELARDFIAAGLLDRAERLLQELVNEAPELKETSLSYLMEIYQDEKEWEQAIAVARRLLPNKLLGGNEPRYKKLSSVIAHYRCELAEASLAKGDYRAAYTEIQQAFSSDRNSVRASLLEGRLDNKTGRYKHALKALRRVREQDSRFLCEAVPELHHAYKTLNDIDEFHNYLIATLADHPSTLVMLYLVEDLIKEGKGEQAARFLSDYLKKYPSLRGLSKLIELELPSVTGKARDNLTILWQLVRQLIEVRPLYQCEHCGFAGRQLHWLCPSCKSWGTISVIRGVEAD